MPRLTLDEILDKQFNTARKGGYDKQEVEEFLDEVYASYRAVLEENEDLQGQSRSLRLENDALGQRVAYLEARTQSPEFDVQGLQQQLADEKAHVADLEEQLSEAQAANGQLQMEAEELRLSAWDIDAEIQAQQKATEFLQNTRKEAAEILREAQSAVSGAVDAAKEELGTAREQLAEYLQPMKEVHAAFESLVKKQGEAVIKAASCIEKTMDIGDKVQTLADSLDHCQCLTMLSTPTPTSDTRPRSTGTNKSTPVSATATTRTRKSASKKRAEG